MLKNTLLVSLIVVLVSACAPVSSVPQVWFDQPLTGASFPPSPVIEITLHAADPGGISQVQLFVNGEVIETIANQFSSTPLAILSTVWQPTAPGRYTLQVRAQSNAGAWSDLATTHIFIGDLSSGSEPTSDESARPSPTWTITPSLVSPTSTYTVTLRVPFTPTSTYVRPTLTPTTYVRPTLTPTTYVQPSLTPTTYVRPTLTPTTYIRPTEPPTPTATTYVRPTLTPTTYIRPTEPPTPTATTYVRPTLTPTTYIRPTEPPTPGCTPGISGCP